MKFPLRSLARCWVVSLLTTSAAAAGHPDCEPSVATQAVLTGDEKLVESCGRSEPCWQQRHQALSAALERQPLDLFLHRAYQDLFSATVPSSASEEKAKLEERYHQLAAEHPGEARFAYLEGRVYFNEPEKSRPHFQRAVELAPAFPWARMALAATPPAKTELAEPGTAAAHLAIFERACPTRIKEVLEVIPALRGETGLDPVVRRVRERLSRRDGADLELWPALWQAEFQLVSPDDLEPVRRQVAADLVRLEKKSQPELASYWHVVIEGNELSRNHGAAAAARRELMRRFPCDRKSAELRFETLEEELPEPSREASEEEAQAWAAAMYHRLRQLSDECPNYTLYRSSRFGAAMRWKGLDTNQGLKEIDAMVVYLKRGAVRLSGGWVPGLAAEFLLSREVELPRVLALTASLREEAEADYRRRLEIPGLPEEMRTNFERHHAFELWRANKLELRALMLLGKTAEAWRLLDDMAASLGKEPEASAGGGTADEETRMFYGVRAAERAALEAELLARGGQILDALAMYREGFDLRRRIGGKPLPEELTAAKKLWDQLGGSADMWSTFTAERQSVESLVVARSAGWKSLNKPLPELALRDLNGKTWTLDDLKGKSVLVNVWATWCRPCHLELPHIQRLHEQFKDDPSVLVLTLNIDASLGPVEPFLTKKQYSFPALLGFDYFEEMTGGMISIPRNWLLSPDGVIRQEQAGFSPEEGESWRLEVAAKLSAGLGAP